MLQRVATRLSLRKVKKEEKVDKKQQEEEKKEEVGKKEEKEEKTESEVVNNGQQESVLHNDETKVGVKEAANEVPTDAGKVSEKGKKKKTKKKKEENEKDEKCEKEEKGGEEEEKEEGVMQRLKSRLSMRGKKKEKINASDQEKECNGTNKEAEKEEEVEKNGKEKEAKEDPVVEEKKWVSGSKETGEKEPEKEEEKKETEKDEKKKSDSNAFVRMLRKLSFRKKKKGKVNDLDEAGAKGEKVETLSDDKAKSEKRFEERETRPQSLVMSSGRFDIIIIVIIVTIKSEFSIFFITQGFKEKSFISYIAIVNIFIIPSHHYLADHPDDHQASIYTRSLIIIIVIVNTIMIMLMITQATTGTRKTSNPPKNDTFVGDCKRLQACLGFGLGAQVFVSTFFCHHSHCHYLRHYHHHHHHCRQFKLSTAESRESLRTLGSRQDLTQVIEMVTIIMITW